MTLAEPARERGAERVAFVATWSIAAVGVALLVWQYVAGASLWIDELAIARNITERSLGQLLGEPLRHYQVAPLGFLALEKIAVTLFGDSERVLRAIPFAAAVAGLLVFTSVALRALPARAAIVAVSIIALAPRLIWSGAQAKQYASDVLATAIVLWVLQRWLADRSWRHTWEAIVVGVVISYISQPSAFVLAGAALAMVLSLWSVAEGAVRRRALLIMLVWGLAVVASALLHRARVAPDVLAFMRHYWVEGFAPFPPRSKHDLLWPWLTFEHLFGATLSLRFASLYVALAVAGAVALVRRSAFGVAVVAPVLIAMAASIPKLFPFSERSATFALPLLALGAAAGVDWLLTALRIRPPYLALACCVAAASPSMGAVVRRPPVYRPQDSKPLVAELAAARQDGDGVYVFYGAAPALRYYGPRLNLSSKGMVFGVCHADLRSYLREVDAFRGRPRVWFVFTHVEARFRERDAIVAYLDSIGTRRAFASSPSPFINSVVSVDVSLYDLSDPARLQTTDASTAPLPTRAAGANVEHDCRGPFTE